MDPENAVKKRRFDLPMFLMTALLSAATFVLNLLLISSLAFLFSTSNSENTERILDSLKVDDVDVSSVFTYHSKAFELLASWQSVLIILGIILVFIVLWGVYYRISSFYASKAVGYYSRITFVTAIIIIVLAVFSQPVISYYFEDFAKANETQLRSFCAVVIISSLILFMLGILTSICSLLLSTAEGAPRKKLIDDDLLEDSISAREIIERKKEKEKFEKESVKKNKNEKIKKPRAITAEEITPHEQDEISERKEIYCENCGAALKQNALFCGQCGRKI